MSTEAPAVEAAPVHEAMSFLDHLDELRRRLTYSAIAVSICFAVCFYYSDKIYSFLDKPVREALKNARSLQIKNQQTPIYSLEELKDNSPFTYVFNAESTMRGVSIPAGTTVPAHLEQRSQGRVVVAAETIVVGK